MKYLRTLVLCGMLLLTGCLAGSRIVNLRQLPKIPSIQPAAEAVPAESGSSKGEMSSAGLSLLVSNEAVDLSNTTAKDADIEYVMKLTFPTPVPEPVSLWRPPLYDTPWALGPYDHFYFSRPIAADQVNWPIPDYRYGGIIFDSGTVHTGIDIPAKRGTAVIAAGAGTVTWTGYGLSYGVASSNDPYGLAVSIEHEFGYKGNKLYTIYAHMDRIDVEVGQTVEAGTPLGIVGLTGNTTGPHLHLEVRVEQDSYYTTRNPELWIAPPQGWGVLAGDFRNTNQSFLDHYLVIVRNVDLNKTWSVYTYGPDTVHKDDYYQENMVIGDLPAGNYRVGIDYKDKNYTCDLKIFPGAITYIQFIGENGCKLAEPPSNGEQNWLEQ